MPPSCPLLALRDRRLLAWAVLWTVVSGLAFGLVTAILPNPVFGRQIPPEPFAIAVWLLSAPLMGLVLATYTTQIRPATASVPLVLVQSAATTQSSDTGQAALAESRSTTLGGIAGLGAFLAIGCPVCNKIALILLGTSGALSVYAPIQPFLGAASLVLLVGTAAWRLRLRTAGGACPV